MGVEVSPITNIRRLESESASVESTPRSRKSKSESRVNQVSSTPSSTPPTPPQSSTKNSRIAVNIRGSKSLRTDEYNSPSRATPTASSRSKSKDYILKDVLTCEPVLRILRPLGITKWGVSHVDQLPVTASFVGVNKTMRSIELTIT
ncbi:hypothetical protein HZ326_17205 [Fusarium oxysporum f. sp. albedinis]|nr:hypothetical protein HZ326_17205 [Fusarium oxysporum f. sp. albedinis]